MSSALRFGGTFDASAFRLYLERLLKDAGAPSDPIERMIVEQCAMAHFRLGEVSVKAGGASGNEATKILNAATARLLGEFRRTTLALASYREKVKQTKLLSDRKGKKS